MVCRHKVPYWLYYDPQGKPLDIELGPSDGRDCNLTKYDVQYKCRKCDTLFAHWEAIHHMEKKLI